MDEPHILWRSIGVFFGIVVVFYLGVMIQYFGSSQEERDSLSPKRRFFVGVLPCLFVASAMSHIVYCVVAGDLAGKEFSSIILLLVLVAEQGTLLTKPVAKLVQGAQRWYGFLELRVFQVLLP